MKTNRRGFLKSLGIVGAVSAVPSIKATEKVIHKTQKEIDEENHPMGSVERSGRLQVMRIPTANRLGVSVLPGKENVLLQVYDGKRWKDYYIVSTKGAHFWAAYNEHKAIRLMGYKLREVRRSSWHTSIERTQLKELERINL